jgi:preprotein translocase subunit SecG
MTTVILVIHMMLAIALVITVLLQRSEGGGLGIGGSGSGGGGMGGLMSVRGTANLLTRATAILAAGFMGTSITLAILANNTREPSSILDRPGMTGAPDAPVKGPVGVPLSK